MPRFSIGKPAAASQRARSCESGQGEHVAIVLRSDVNFLTDQHRWPASDPEAISKLAREIVNTQPDTHHARRDLLEQLRDPTVHSGSGQPGSIQTVAPSFGVELRPVDVRDAGIRALPKWRFDCDGEQAIDRSS
jgi:hypothetical protein